MSTRFSKILNVRLKRDESKVVVLSNWKLKLLLCGMEKSKGPGLHSELGI